MTHAWEALLLCCRAGDSCMQAFSGSLAHLLRDARFALPARFVRELVLGKEGDLGRVDAQHVRREVNATLMAFLR